MKTKKVTARVVAEALCRASDRVGRTLAGEGRETLEERVGNLLREIQTYGAYVVDGDPSEWADGGTALATIYMEQKTDDDDDPGPPLEYYEDGLEVSLRASALLPGTAFIEFVNPAVALVWEG
jgi:hypothetical protein